MSIEEIQEELVRDSAGWQLRFVRGEREARRAAGEWTGKTIADYLRERVVATPDAIAFAGETGSRTYAELATDAVALARGMLARGLRRGDTVAFQLPNWMEAAVINLACGLAGLVIVPVIPIYRHAELRLILADCHAKMIFIPRVFRSIDYAQMMAELRSELPQLTRVVVVRDPAESGALTYEALLEAGRGLDTPLQPSGPDDAKVIIYTSGTTGRPKGVLYTHNQGRYPITASVRAWQLPPDTVVFVPSPVTHISGYEWGLEAPFHYGFQAVFMERWDAQRAVEVLRDYRHVMTIAATPFLGELVQESQKQRDPLRALDIFCCGGAAVPPDLIRRANQTFANCRAFRAYGSSECPVITQGSWGDPERGATTDGLIFGWEVKIVDDDGKRVPHGNEGEILARGPGMFRGYTRPEDNAGAFDAEGYFRTGDIGVVDAAGYLTITGRKKDLIIRGGENLSAKEIEDALHAHPAIREAAVVAMPHERLGEGVCAYLIASSTEQPDRAALADYLTRAGLARQKCPERVVYVDELPKTASGKVQKHVLRRRIAEQIAREKVKG